MPQTYMPSNSSLTDCEVRVEHWFSPIPHVMQEGCMSTFSLLWNSFSVLDLLGNNKPRAFFTDYSTGEPLLSTSTLFVNEFRQLPDGSTASVPIAILSPNDSELISNFQALGLGDGTWGFRSGGGFADMDGDGDLDLVCVCLTQGGIQRVWLENIKGDAVRPNPYDLDQDGEVGAADIGILLLNFG